MKLEFFRHIFEKYPNIKFNENSFSGRRDIRCRHMDGRTDVTKLIVAFRNFAKSALKVSKQRRVS
jgi:hypothetical protein